MAAEVEGRIEGRVARRAVAGQPDAVHSSPSNRERDVMSWIRIASSESIPPREGRAAVIGARQIAIFNLGDRFLAVDNQCPHQSGPLCDGIVAGDAVVCPLHAWKVNLQTGAVAR